MNTLSNELLDQRENTVILELMCEKWRLLNRGNIFTRSRRNMSVTLITRFVIVLLQVNHQATFLKGDSIGVTQFKSTIILNYCTPIAWKPLCKNVCESWTNAQCVTKTQSIMSPLCKQQRRGRYAHMAGDHD